MSPTEYAALASAHCSFLLLPRKRPGLSSYDVQRDVGSASFVRLAQRSNAQEIASETAEGIPNYDIAITPLAVLMFASPVAISTVVLLEVQAISWIYRVLLLACVVLVGLASYAVFVLGASGAKWIRSVAEKIITRLRGLRLAALAIQFLF